MSGIGAPPVTVVHPGEGRTGDLGSIGVAFKLWGEDTGGAISIVEHPFPVGALVPPHLHTREDEYSIVTQGIGCPNGPAADREVRPLVLEPVAGITKPRGELGRPFTLECGSWPSAGAHMIEVISPERGS